MSGIPLYIKALIFMWLPLLLMFGLLAYYNRTNGVPHDYRPPFEVEGYWGPPTSNVDWCEQNYVFTTYVAEALNTLSSFAFVVLGAFGMVASFVKKLETRFFVCYFCIALVGFGSALFHATLLRSTQMMDEVPMGFSMLSILYIHESIEHDPKERSTLLPVVLFATGIAMLVVYLAFPGNAVPFQMLFVGSIAVVVFFLIHRSHIFVRHDAAKKLLGGALVFFLLGCSSWMIERETCVHLYNLNLHWVGYLLLNMHSWWHVFMSIGLYFFIMYNEYLRLYYLGKSPQLKTYLLPFVSHSHAEKVAQNGDLPSVEIIKHARSPSELSETDATVANGVPDRHFAVRQRDTPTITPKRHPQQEANGSAEQSSRAKLH